MSVRDCLKFALVGTLWPGILWSQAGTYQTRSHLMEDRHLFSGKRHVLPRMPGPSSFEGNVRETERRVGEDPGRAFRWWVDAVSGNWSPFAGWSGEDAPNWNYKALYSKPAKVGENAGNFNFSITGFRLFSELSRQGALPVELSDSQIMEILRLGGGAFQIATDIMNDRLRGDYTWYGERVEDVAIIQTGLDYARFMALKKIGDQYDVALSEKMFGFEYIDPNIRYQNFSGDYASALERDRLVEDITREPRSYETYRSQDAFGEFWQDWRDRERTPRREVEVVQGSDEGPEFVEDTPIGFPDESVDEEFPDDVPDEGESVIILRPRP